MMMNFEKRSKKSVVCLAILVLMATACGDTESKLSSSNNVPVNNQVPAGVQEFCSSATQPANCGFGGRDEFAIVFNVTQQACVQERTEELVRCPELTIDSVNACYQAIEACASLAEDIVDACSDLSECEQRISEDSGKANYLIEEFTAEFLQVEELITNSCAVNACHGALSTTFSFENDQISRPYEVRAVLEDTIAISTGRPLIDPGNPEGSEIFVRLSLERSNPLMMPQTGKLPQEDIDLVRDWIADGAVYTLAE